MLSCVSTPLFLRVKVDSPRHLLLSRTQFLKTSHTYRRNLPHQWTYCSCFSVDKLLLKISLPYYRDFVFEHTTFQTLLHQFHPRTGPVLRHQTPTSLTILMVPSVRSRGMCPHWDGMVSSPEAKHRVWEGKRTTTDRTTGPQGSDPK